MNLFASRSDLPLDRDASSRYLPWLVALMVFLAAVAVASMFVLHGLIERWDRDVVGTLTVQVAPAVGEGGTAATGARLEAVMGVLRDTAGIAAVRPLDQSELVALVEPWLGNSDLVADLPLPQLIDVRLEPKADVDLARLSQRLAAVAPGVSLDDHRTWLSRLVNLSRTIEWLAAAIVVLIGSVTALTVVYAVRTGMAIHDEVIQVLHLTGAHDDYIARQFADHAFASGMRGGFIGISLAVPTLVAISWMARRIEGGFLPELSLSLTGWMVVALLPAAVGVLAMMTARLTVHRAIARMW